MTLLLLLRSRGGVQIFPEPPEDRTFKAPARLSQTSAGDRPSEQKAPALPEDYTV